MTHAYLQQLYGGTIRPHGKEFGEKILKINIALDLDITVKHDFLSWWRCDGICRTKDVHFYGYLSGVDEQQVFQTNPEAVKNHAKFCGGTFSKTEEPNAEILSTLRRIKRKRKSMHEIVNVGEIHPCKNAKGDISLKRHNTPNRKRTIHYATDSGEE